MSKRATSFRLQPETISLLKQLAQDESRSITNMLERLIEEKAKEKESNKRNMETWKPEAKLKV